MSVQSRSDGVNTSLFEKREHIEKLHRTYNLLRKVQVLTYLSNKFFFLKKFTYRSIINNGILRSVAPSFFSTRVESVT